MWFGFRGKGWWGALTLCVTLTGCAEDPALGGSGAEDESGSGDEGSSTGEPATIDAQIEAFVAMRCERAAACDCAGIAGSDACVEADTAAWEARIAAGEERGLVRDDACVLSNLATLETAGCRWPSTVLEDGTHLCGQYCAVYYGDRGAGEACQAYDSLVSDCAQGLLCDAGTCVEPCTRLTGLPLGQTCGSELSGPFEDCATGGYCDWQNQACAPFAQPGENCDNRACAENAWCDWNTSTCAAIGGAGDSCAGSGDCQDDLWCDWSSPNPTCRAPSVAGQSCASAPCADGLVCDGSICAAPPPAGQPCLSGSCAEGAICDWDVNQCLAPPSVGQACLFGTCASDAWCDTSTDPEGICALIQENGESCTGHSQCESGYCPRGYCEARPEEGEDCSVLFICARGLVCNGATCQPTSFRGPAACVYPAW